MARNNPKKLRTKAAKKVVKAKRPAPKKAAKAR